MHKELTKEDLEPKNPKIEMTQIGTLFGFGLWIATNNDHIIKLSEKFLNGKIDDADRLLMSEKELMGLLQELK